MNRGKRLAGTEKNTEQAVEMLVSRLDAEKGDDSRRESIAECERLNRSRAETEDPGFCEFQMHRPCPSKPKHGRDKRKMHSQGSLHRMWSNPLPEPNASTCPRRNADSGERQQSKHGAPDIDAYQKFPCRLAVAPTDPVLDCGAADRQYRNACDEDQKIAEPGLKSEGSYQHDQPQKTQYGERCV
jgi:hypothetical protein